MKKQTAVEWLIEQYGHSIHTIQINEQAKAMEKEQIVEAIDYGCSDWGSVKNAEVYYNETYNK